MKNLSFWDDMKKNFVPVLLRCLQQMKVKESESEVAQPCPTLRSHGLQPIRLLRPWDFPGKSAGVDCHFLLQGIFPTQELNWGLLHCRQTPYRLSHREVNRWSESQCIIDPLIYPELTNILIIYSKKSYEDSESLNCGLAFIILSHYLCA